MPKFAPHAQRRALYVVEPKREYFIRLSNAIEASGWIALQRTYRDEGFWTLQRRIEPLVR